MTAKKLVSYDPNSPDDLKELMRHLHHLPDYDFKQRLNGLERAAKAELKGHAGFEYDSVPGYAARALVILNYLKAQLDKGDAVMAASFAFDLGVLLQESMAKLDWERAALSGKKCIDAGKGNSRQKIERDVKMAREFQRRWPKSGLSASALKVEIGKGQRLKRRGAIQAINRGLKKIVHNPV